MLYEDYKKYPVHSVMGKDIDAACDALEVLASKFPTENGARQELMKSVHEIRLHFHERVFQHEYEAGLAKGGGTCDHFYHYTENIFTPLNTLEWIRPPAYAELRRALYARAGIRFSDDQDTLKYASDRLVSLVVKYITEPIIDGRIRNTDRIRTAIEITKTIMDDIVREMEGQGANSGLLSRQISDMESVLSARENT